MPRRRLLPPTLLVLALWLPLACGEGSAGRGHHAAAAFPVRLLALPDTSGPAALLDDDLSDLGPWWLFDTLAGTLSGAADNPALQSNDDGVTLARADTILVRFVKVPAGETVVLEARLDTGAEPRVGALCQPLTLALLTESEQPGDAALLSGGADGQAPAHDALAQRVLRLMREAPAVQEADWSSLPDAAGLAQARALQSKRDSPSLRAIMLGAPRAGARFASVSLRPRAAVARLHAGGEAGEVLDPEALADGPLALSLRIHGERRNALVVPPGRTATLTAHVPAGAARLTFGLALRPGSEPGARAAWRVELLEEDQAAGDGGSLTLGPPASGFGSAPKPAQPAPATGGATHGADAGSSAHAPRPAPLGAGDIAHPTGGPLLWRDVTLPWPDDWSCGPVSLRLSVQGDDAVAFGQPMISGPARARRPNLLFVSLDTVRADRLSVYGYERPTTPFLERFAARAVLFEDCSSVGPYTLPTHASMLSGLLPLRHNVVDSGADRVNAAAMPWLPQLLARSGWSTAAFTGGGFLSADYGFAAGFDRFGIVDPIVHRGSDYARHRYARDVPPYLEQIEERAQLSHVIDWIEEQREQPWFAFVHTYAAHDYLPPEADRALFDSAPDDTWGRDWREVQSYLAPDGWPQQGLDPARARRLSDLYDATLRFTDRELGAFLDALDARGLLDETVVVITSDHGEEFGEHGGLRHSTTLYQEMLHVPLLLSAPDVPGGRRLEQPVSLTDLLPTLLSLLGLPPLPDGAVDGRDLSPLLRGESARLPPPLLVGHVRTLNARRTSLRIGAHKLIRGDEGQVRFPASDWELFELASDPQELRELLAGSARPGEPHDAAAGDAAGDAAATDAAADATAAAAGPASNASAPARDAELSKWQARLADVEAELRARAVEAGASDVGDAVLQQLRALGYIR